VTTIESDKKLHPAYVPFDTFEGFVDTLKQTTVPDHIDKQLMRKMSGAMQSHLLSALKFLNLISPKNETREPLHKLVQSRGTDQWKAALAAVIEPVYAPIIGDLNLKAGTAKNLRERFKEKGNLDGQTLDKAIRFYLKALKTAGIDYSPHFQTRKSPGKRQSVNGRGRQESPAPKERQATEGHRPARSEQREGTITFPIYFPDKVQGEIVVPRELSETDLGIVDAAVAMIKAYATANKGN
jgi:hypothetical protein